MGLHRDHDFRDDHQFSDYMQEEDAETRHHRKRVRQLLEEKLERKRLKEELEDIDGLVEDEFDWNEKDKD